MIRHSVIFSLKHATKIYPANAEYDDTIVVTNGNVANFTFTFLCGVEGIELNDSVLTGHLGSGTNTITLKALSSETNQTYLFSIPILVDSAIQVTPLSTASVTSLREQSYSNKVSK